MDQVLGHILRNAVWERLDMLTDIAQRADAHSLLSVARSELPRLAEAWRSMLEAHEPDERGDCPTCSTRWHRSKAPCSVWQVAHEHLVAGGLAPLTAPARLPVPQQGTRTESRAAVTAGRHALRPRVAGAGTG